MACEIHAGVCVFICCWSQCKGTCRLLHRSEQTTAFIVVCPQLLLYPIDSCPASSSDWLRLRNVVQRDSKLIWAELELSRWVGEEQKVWRSAASRRWWKKRLEMLACGVVMGDDSLLAWENRPELCREYNASTTDSLRRNFFLSAWVT